MKLNPDCIRDILFEIEEHSKWGVVYEYLPDELPEGSHLKNYDAETIMYHVRQCNLSGYLIGVQWKCTPYVAIEDLSPLGHDLIGNITSEEKWMRTKSILSRLGGAGLKMISATAEGVATAFLNKYVDEMSHIL